MRTWPDTITSSRRFSGSWGGWFALIMLLLIPAAGTAGVEPGALSLSATLDNPLVVAGRPATRYLEVLITTPGQEQRKPDSFRAPLNIALVIDRSGSMGSENKLQYVRQAAIAMLDWLKPGDYFSLISYDTSVRVHIPSGSVEDIRWAQSVIRGLEPGGSTNLGGGLQEGYRQVARHASPGSINRVLLLSDGLANVGIKSPARLSAIALNEAQRGISLSTFGVGLDFNEDLMAALSESGQGMYYFIDEPERIYAVLAREFQNIESLVAKDIRLTIEFDRDVTIDKVFANSFRVHGKRLSVRMGDLSAGELRRMQVRFTLPALAEGRYTISRLQMDYRLPDRRERRVDRLVTSLVAENDPFLVDRGRNPGVSERSCVFEAHDARSRAARAVDGNDLQGAERILAQMKDRLLAAPVQGKKVEQELAAIENYADALKKPMNRKLKARIQKRVKYKSYTLEGC